MQATTSKSCRSGLGNIPAALDEVKDKLRSKPRGGYITGFGIRGAAAYTDLFEKLVNAGRQIVPGAKIVFNTRADNLFECVVRRDRSQTSVQVLRTRVQCDSESILSLTSCSKPGFSIVLSVTVQTVGSTSMSDPMHNPQFIPSCVMPDALRALMRQAIALGCCQYRDP